MPEVCFLFGCFCLVRFFCFYSIFPLSMRFSRKAIAIGSSWIAVATSANFLRVFSYSGLPLLVCSLEGDIVCMSGSQNQLLIAFHEGSPINGQPSALVVFCFVFVFPGFAQFG